MKKTLKMIISLALVLVLAFTMVPAQAYAASETYIEVTKDNAPARAKKYESGKILYRCAKGTILKATPVWNSYAHQWYQFQLEDGRTAYIYSKNVRQHKHEYKEYETGIGTFRVCAACGCVQVKNATDAKKVSVAKTFAINALTRLRVSGFSGLGKAVVDTLVSVNKANKNSNILRADTLTLAASAMAIDGPLPAGDIVAAFMVASAAAVAIADADSMSAMNSSVDMQTFITGITSAEFLELLKNSTTKCSPYTFKRVVRVGDDLKYVDRKCLNVIEAYICVLLGMNVYTESDATAQLLADMFPMTVWEHDKDKPTHYWHYHPLNAKGYREHVHIWHGKADGGRVPTY